MSRVDISPINKSHVKSVWFTGVVNNIDCNVETSDAVTETESLLVQNYSLMPDGMKIYIYIILFFIFFRQWPQYMPDNALQLSTIRKGLLERDASLCLIPYIFHTPHSIDTFSRVKIISCTEVWSNGVLVVNESTPLNKWWDLFFFFNLFCMVRLVYVALVALVQNMPQYQ